VGRRLFRRKSMKGTAAVLSIAAAIGCSQIACTAKVPTGFHLDIATSPEWCGDEDWIAVKSAGNHMASINGRKKLSIPVSVSQVRHMLQPAQRVSCSSVASARYPTAISLNS